MEGSGRGKGSGENHGGVGRVQAYWFSVLELEDATVAGAPHVSGSREKNKRRVKRYAILAVGS